MPEDDTKLVAKVRQKGAKLLGRHHDPALLLLADLRGTHRMAAGVSLDREILAQPAQALKDTELLSVTKDCHPRTLRQLRWANAQLKAQSAQVMVTGWAPCDDESVTTTDRDLARWRLRSQHLVAPHAASAEEVVRHLLAVQAENPGQAAWAVASRTQRPDAEELDGLLDQGRVVRTHVLRPTWHFVATEDIGWLLELTAPRILPVFTKQLDALGLAGARLDRARSIVLDTLTQQSDRTRDELADSLRGEGLELGGQELMLLLGLLELDRLVCSGRRREDGHSYAIFADRVRSPRRPDRDEALAELALRYFTSHGPATERDLAYWATLTLTDVRRGIAQVGDRLASFEHDGRTFWHTPGDLPRARRHSPAAHLLQILDEIYRGYQDSRMVLDSEGIVPGGRETAIGMALVDAQLIARMKRTLGRRAVFAIAPFAPLEESDLAALEQAAARYAAFLRVEHELRVG